MSEAKTDDFDAQAAVARAEEDEKLKLELKDCFAAFEELRRKTRARYLLAVTFGDEYADGQTDEESLVWNISNFKFSTKSDKFRVLTQTLREQGWHTKILLAGEKSECGLSGDVRTRLWVTRVPKIIWPKANY